MVLQGRAARTVPVAFRLWALASRFLLVFFLAGFLPPAEVGLYGLVAAMVAYVVYLLGADMYTYTTREVIKSAPSSWRIKVTSHAAFLGCVSFIVLPALVLLFVTGLLPWEVAVWFYLIAITEHLGMELDRILVAMSDQLAASLVILVRQAALPTALIPLMIFLPATRHVEWLFIGWFCFNALAITLGVLLMLRRAPAPPRLVIEWRWVRHGVLVSIPFLIGTLCLRLIFTVDRQLVAVLADLDTLAVYTLAMSIAGGVSSVLAVGVHQFVYPQLVKSANERDQLTFRRDLRSLWVQTAIIAGTAFLGVLLLHNWIAGWFGHEIYVEYAWLLPIAVGVIAIYNLSLVPHYALYALHADRVILVTTVSALLGFAATISIALALGISAVLAVTIGVGAGSVILFGAKYLAYRRRLRELIDIASD